jgi:hypothetical protein
VYIHAKGISIITTAFLFLDGYIIHTSPAFLRFLLDNNVTPIFIPAHTSEKLQPLVSSTPSLLFFLF